MTLDLRDRSRDVPDFPSEGIVFKDLMPLIADAEYFAEVYPRFGEFTALRDRLDPQRLFGNDYLRRVLGD